MSGKEKRSTGNGYSMKGKQFEAKNLEKAAMTNAERNVLQQLVMHRDKIFSKSSTSWVTLQGRENTYYTII